MLCIPTLARWNEKTPTAPTLARWNEKTLLYPNSYKIHGACYVFQRWHVGMKKIVTLITYRQT
jgi:hypothetical protein